jgi:hypothetical protein
VSLISSARGRVVLGAVTVAFFGCDGSPRATRACDPLQTVTTPVTLGHVIAVGRDQQGTIYVLDEIPAGGQRLFASQGPVLARQVTRGGGSVSDATGTLTIVIGGDAASPLNVEVHTDTAGEPTVMGVYKGTLTTKTFEIGALGEVLQLLTTDAISGLTLQNLPGTVSIQHLAALSDGRELMVTVPDVDATPNDERIFFGTPPRLIERRLTPTAQPRSFTQLTFDLDGKQATVTFSSLLNPGVTSMLSAGGTTFPLTEAPVGTPPAGVTFLCF